MTNQEAIETLQDIHDVAECWIKNGDSRGIVYIPEEKLPAFETAVAAVEKQIPMKPLKKDNKCPFDRCPTCGGFVDDAQNHCEHCGQALDWSE